MLRVDRAGLPPEIPMHRENGGIIGPEEEWPVKDGAFPDLSQIYQAYHGKVLAYATRLLGREGADDVSQEVFIKIGRSLGTLADPSKLTSWIYAITLNTVRDATRKRSSRPDRFSGAHDSAHGVGEGEMSRVPDTVSRTPEEIAIRNEMVACYLDYVTELPRNYYEAYVLSEFEHLSNEDIARRLSLFLGTVKIRLHRARARLHEELRRNCQCYYNERGELMGEPKSREGKLDFSGEWSFNKEKSRWQLEALARLELAALSITHREPRFRLHRAFVIEGQRHEVAFDLTTDGNEIVRYEDERELRSRLRWEGDALVFTTRILTPAGEAINAVTYRMLPPGRQLEADERYRGPGLSYDNLWVFDKDLRSSRPQVAGRGVSRFGEPS